MRRCTGKHLSYPAQATVLIIIVSLALVNASFVSSKGVRAPRHCENLANAHSVILSITGWHSAQSATVLWCILCGACVFAKQESCRKTLSHLNGSC